MLWRSTESLMSIHVGIQTQNKFENSKNNLELAGQKNTDQKIIEIPDFFNENGKSMLNVS